MKKLLLANALMLSLGLIQAQASSIKESASEPGTPRPSINSATLSEKQSLVRASSIAAKNYSSASSSPKSSVDEEELSPQINMAVDTFTGGLDSVSNFFAGLFINAAKALNNHNQRMNHEANKFLKQGIKEGSKSIKYTKNAVKGGIEAVKGLAVVDPYDDEEYSSEEEITPKAKKKTTAAKAKAKSHSDESSDSEDGI